MDLWIEYQTDFTSPSGYSRAARNHVRALLERGVRVSGIPNKHDITNVVLDQFWAKNMDKVLNDERGAPIKVWHETPEFYEPHPAQYNIAMLTFEADRIPAHDVNGSPRNNWVRQLNRMDEIWTFSSFMIDVFRHSGIKDSIPIHVFPHPIDIGQYSTDIKPMQLYNHMRKPIPEDTFVFMSAFQWCHDDQTRVLTREGFKYFRDVTEEDELATLNRETEELEYQRPLSLHRSKYDGEMVRIRSNMFDMHITPNHKMLVRDITCLGAPWELREVKDIINQQTGRIKQKFQTKKSCYWNGEEREQYDLPHVYQEQGRNVSVSSVPMDPWLKFLGWYISEGSATIAERGYHVEISQVSNEQYKLEIEQTIKDVGFHPVRKTAYGVWKATRINSKQLCMWLRPMGHAHEKYVPQFIKDLSIRQIRLFLDTLFKGDGRLDKEGNWVSYVTSSKRLAEDVLECLLKVGYSGAISVSEPTQHEYDRRTIKGKHRQYCVSVNKKQNTPSLYYADVTQDPYYGWVYCAEVPNGTLFTERNGKVIWSGNSARKNPYRLFSTYLGEFSKNDNVCLMVKTYSRDFSPQSRKVVVDQIHDFKKYVRREGGLPPVYFHLEPIPDGKMHSFLGAADVGVSASYAEGFGLPVQEHMALGVPCIVPQSSSFPDFVNEENGWLTPTFPVPIFGQQFPWYEVQMNWWEIQACEMQKHMREAYENRELTKQKGQAARAFVKANHSLKAVGSQMEIRLEKIAKAL